MSISGLSLIWTPECSPGCGVLRREIGRVGIAHALRSMTDGAFLRKGGAASTSHQRFSTNALTPQFTRPGSTGRTNARKTAMRQKNSSQNFPVRLFAQHSATAITPLNHRPISVVG